ncbi:hypothetical protein I3842_05G153000 [Carya illinoinensis]|uniref:Uncharacterized protein n=1 Tax=Carya illinoinensis TaxID=32201 RepID=A0A922F3E8_CARIL|nr:hypothetical protein I3842_05G153000 [Carya illinoinensis]
MLQAPILICYFLPIVYCIYGIPSGCGVFFLQEYARPRMKTSVLHGAFIYHKINSYRAEC